MEPFGDSKHQWYGIHDDGNIINPKTKKMKQSIFASILSGFSLLLFFAANQVSAITYYIATNGSDSNKGVSLSYPFLSLAKALALIQPGDTIIVRGGNYSFSSGISISDSGSAGKYFFLWAFQGERPIFDFSRLSLGSRGVSLSGNYWHVKGFDFARAGDNGLYLSKGGYNIIEYCSFYENKDSGLQLSGGAHDNKIINCDSYYNADPPDYGDADGFACKMDVGTNNSFFGCRSWLNVDDGWDGYLRGSDDVTTVIENCWTWRNGYFKDGTDAGPNANGNGFKMGGSDDKLAKHNFTLKNCIAFDNKVKGFDQNNNKGSMVLYNCTAYRNGGNNFSISQQLATGKILEVKNCVAVDAKVSLGSFAIQSTNSWINRVASNDFLSLDTSGVSGPRKSDGSLPDIPFLHLSQGSNLIDAGTIIGLPFNGKAPDPGAFEFSFVTGFEPARSQNIRLLAYPNPFKDFFIIDISLPEYQKVAVSLINIRGEKIWNTANMEADRMGLRISCNSGNIKPGIYFIVAETRNEKYRTKILKI
jgi:hypothetical protein